MITAADENAIGQVARPRVMTRAGNRPDGLRWIARQVKPSCRHLKNLTDSDKKTSWNYSITCTNRQSPRSMDTYG
jgi:hypothetical protein